MKERDLVDLSSYILTRLGYERRAACHGLFATLPPSMEELELFNLMHWFSIGALSQVDALRYLAYENRQHLKELTEEAEESGEYKELLPYARQIVDEMKAAEKLIRKVNNGRR